VSSADITKKADAVDGALMKSGGKNKKLLDSMEKLRNETDAAVSACFTGKVKAHPRSRPLKSRRRQLLRR
jgi:hypothetical protein